jgi:hypothetical protein
MADDPKKKGKTDELDTGELYEDFGALTGIGVVLARDENGKYLNPELVVLAYKSQGWTKAKLSPNGKKVIPGKKEEGVEWDSNKITAELTKTNWYDENDGNIRVADNAKATDSATYMKDVGNVKEALKRIAVQRGADLSGYSEEQLDELAEDILRSNYSYITRGPDSQIPDSVLDSYLTPLISMGGDGSMKGEAGLTASGLRQMAEQYGVMFSDKWYLEQIQALDNGTTTEFDVKAQIVDSARETWSTIGDQINENRSTYQIADSYIQRMAATWEMDPDTINLETPEIKNALMKMGPDGQPYRQTMWEFEQDLRNDPRWDNTKQGQKELGDGSMMMLKELGFWK